MIDLRELFVGKQILMKLDAFRYEDRYLNVHQMQKIIYKYTPQNKTPEEIISPFNNDVVE